MERTERQLPIEQNGQQENTATSFEIITDPEQREALVWCADRLIEKIISEKFNCLVFLDQSARPVSWLARERFKFLQNSKQGIFADEKNSDARFPEVKFICFGPSDKENARDRKKKQSMAEELKKIFQKPEGEKTYFDNKKTLIIDEYSPAFYSEDNELPTVSAARQLLAKSFSSRHARFFDTVFIPKEKRTHFLKTGGVPWRSAYDTYKGISGISEINKKKQFLSRPYKHTYPSILNNLEQRKLGILQFFPSILNEPTVRHLRDRLQVLSVIKNCYDGAADEEKVSIVMQTLDQLSQIKKDRPDLRDDLQYVEDMIRLNVVEPLVDNNFAKELADYMPELTKKLRKEIERIAQHGLS